MNCNESETPVPCVPSVGLVRDGSLVGASVSMSGGLPIQTRVLVRCSGVGNE